MAFVTFIIPTLWRPSLVRAVESLLAQTDPDWEAIICPDAYSSGAVQLPPDSRIRYVHVAPEESGSAGTVRNVGLDAIFDGEWIAFLDDDDCLTPTYVEHLREHAEDHPLAELVIFRMKHPQFGVLPPVWNEIRKGTVGISFAVKRRTMRGRRFIRENVSAQDHEDWAMIQELTLRGTNGFLSPHIDYLVRDAA